MLHAECVILLFLVRDQQFFQEPVFVSASNLAFAPVVSC